MLEKSVVRLEQQLKMECLLLHPAASPSVEFLVHNEVCPCGVGFWYHYEVKCLSVCSFHTTTTKGVILI